MLRRVFPFVILSVLGVLLLSNVQVSAETAPSFLPNVTFLSATNNNTLQVQWKVPATETNVTKYMICFQRTPEALTCTNNITVQGSNTANATIVGLLFGIEYEVAVKAGNDNGFGDFGLSGKATTPEATPGSGPTITSLTTHSATALEVKWSKLSETQANGIITMYKICYQKKSVSEIDCKTSLEVNNNTFDRIISGLDNYTEYTVGARARTAVGYGPVGNTMDKRTGEAAPGSGPTITSLTTHSATALEVKWSKLSGTQANGIITMYKICYQKKSVSEIDCKTSLEVNNNTFDRIISGLDIYTEYTVGVKARTVVGYGPVGKTMDKRTGETAPGSGPTITSLTTHSATALEVKWSKLSGTQANGIITMYKICYQKKSVSEIDCKTSLEVNNNTFDRIISGLDIYTEYTVGVKARTVVGYGPVGKTMDKRTGETAPGSGPTITSLTTHSATALEVKWSKLSGTQANGIITMYKICYQKKSVSEIDCKTSLEVNNNTFDRIISGLDIYTEYTVGVKARTLVGYGSVGNTMYKRTDEAEPDIGPTIESVTAESSSKLNVTWGDLTDQQANGKITEFTVCYKIDGASANICDEKKTSSVNNIILDTLLAFTKYKVGVKASTSKGYGPLGETTEVTTSQAVPSVGPTLKKLVAIGPKKLYLEWDSLTKSQANGDVVKYGICYKIESSDFDICKTSETINATSLNYTLSNLNEYTNYTVAVRAKTIDFGDHGNALSARTNESKPASGPDIQTLEPISSTTLKVTWGELSHDDANGIIIEYEICWRKVGEGSNKCETSTLLSFTINKLTPNTKYDVAIKARTSVGYGPNGTTETTSTKEGKPSKPQEVSSISSFTTLSLTWKSPETPNGKITMYNIWWVPANGDGQPDSSRIRVTNKQQLEYVITKLNPGATYRVNISAYTSAGQGAIAVNVMATKKSAIGPSVSVTLSTGVVDDEKTQMAFKLPSVNTSEEASISSFQVIVKIWNAGDEKLSETKQSDLKSYSESNNGQLPYIAVFIKKYERGKQVIIGDGASYNNKRKKRATGQTYENVPLKEDTTYGIFIRVFYDEDLTIYSSSGVLEHKTEGPNSNPTVIIVLVVIFIIVALLVVVFGVLLYRRRKRPDNTHKPIPMPVVKKHYPIPVNEFRAHCDQLALNAGMGYQEEYESIRPTKPVSAEIAKRNENIDKNRYNNIHAYDDTRVILKEIDGVEGSDYINANHIDGFNREHQFIASQGPTKNTIDDFWRMVWEQEVSTIVMVTNPVEKGKEKCAMYWPQDKIIKHGAFEIKLDGEVELADFVIREMSVTKEDQKECRKVTQFHYTVWPDHGVPSYTTSLQAFLSRVRKTVKGQKCPLLVHCSAGVGRTGTFIGIFSMLDRIDARKDIDIYNFICQLRSQRVFMVQVESQYVLLHKAVLEAVECGDTEITTTNVRIQVKKLDELDPGNPKQTLMQKQFKVLNDYTYKKTNDYEGKREYNTSKNRSEEVIPYEDTRVSLLRSPGVDGSDYINASFIDSYQKRGMYIATQYPLENTVNDFWRMIWEKRSNCIIMLVNLENEPFEKYWTEQQNDAMLCGNLLVTLENEENHEEFVKRKFKFKKTDGGETRTIYHFNYLSWGENTTPKTTSGILTMINKVLEVQRNSGNNSIVVHCSDGAGRTGAFCALLTSLERMKQDHNFNLFQTIMLQRIQRPEMVASVDQYHFCFKVILAYLDTFDTTNYDNYN